MAGETLPGTAVDDGASDRVVLHVDMDCFYASCERLRRPECDDEPLVIGRFPTGGFVEVGQRRASC